ncbi:PREDICTED: muscle M-line assembly protein unc-89-like [Atta cephalotes]|uniref:Ig-like domain-containing protein n=1 Tax=Atta cephalotes TaxID=12957 RepID=A0A158NY86_ATTCE|nr:PREDICTED: muscle M-line assembly protein unc-89-like [Atta cephalotes]
MPLVPNESVSFLALPMWQGDCNYYEVERCGGSIFDDAHLPHFRVREPQICECTFSALELGQGLAPILPFADAEIADWPCNLKFFINKWYLSEELALIVRILLFSGGIASCLRNFRTDFLEEWPTPGTGPHFDISMQSNFTGLVGKTVHLVCKVKNLGNRTVSWVRHRDIHLLTVGRYTYTSDQRFEALHSPHTEDWTLRIRYPQRKDSGIYECQISTTPPIGHPVYLTIVEPITIIIGAPDLFVNKGSTINLTCVVKYAPEPPPTMTWSHNTEVINFDSPRGGISLVTEKGPETTSRLMIQKAVSSDSGIYRCEPSNANPSSIKVHVVNEEHPAAMHHGESGSSSYSKTRLICFIILVIANIMFI